MTSMGLDAYDKWKLYSRARFSFSATPRLSEDGEYVDVDYEVVLLVPLQSKFEGMYVLPSKPALRKVFQHRGSHNLPMGGSILLHTQTDEGRKYAIIFHVASVRR